MLYVRILIKKRVGPPHKTNKQQQPTMYYLWPLKCPTYTFVHYIQNNFHNIIQIIYSADLMFHFYQSYIAASPELQHQPLTLQYHEKDSLTSLTTELNDEISNNWKSKPPTIYFTSISNPSQECLTRIKVFVTPLLKITCLLLCQCKTLHAYFQGLMCLLHQVLWHISYMKVTTF